MWKKIATVLLLRIVKSIDWEALVKKALARLSILIKIKLGVTVNLNDLDVEDIFALVEEVLAEYLGIKIDLNNDGQIGDGVDG